TYEQKNTNIEIVLDFDTIKNIYLNSGVNYQEILTTFKAAGMTSVILREDKVKDLVEDGKATLVSGKDILNDNRISGGRYGFIYSKIPRERPLQPEYNYLVIGDPNLFEYAKRNLEIKLGVSRIKDLGSNLLEVTAQTDDLLETSLDINPDKIALIYKYSLAVIPEISNYEGFNQEVIASKISDLSKSDVKVITFKDNEALGYKKYLQITALKIREQDLFFGFTEFVKPKGLEYLAMNAPNKALKIHYMIVGEDSQNYLNRAYRAITERNANIIHIDIASDKNNFSKNKENSYKETYNLIQQLREKINKIGYEVKAIDYIKKPQTTNIVFFQIIAYFAVSLMFILFVKLFIKELTSKESFILFLSILAIGGVAYLTTTVKLYNEYMALLTACVAPVIVFIIIKKILDKNLDKGKPFIPILVFIFISTIITGIIITTLLFHYNYFVAIWTFRGVKLANTIPIFLLAIFLFVRPKRIKYLYQVLDRYFAGILTFKYLFIIVFLTLFLAFYILRTGNYGILILGRAEIGFRELLENIFLVRPRFKEFLFAVPLLMLAINYWKTTKIHSTMMSVILLFASIASISQINTFCHLHSPFITSLYRSFLGLFLGYLIGMFLIFIINKSIKFANKISKKLDTWEN
ncbi:MAG: DUF5693 family protein, partial [Candidatus Riflemargulisbacteria bacterium]